MSLYYLDDLSLGEIAEEFDRKSPSRV
ncbi:hypothetical protein ACT7DH_28640 [Bacillus pacificus]